MRKIILVICLSFMLVFAGTAIAENVDSSTGDYRDNHVSGQSIGILDVGGITNSGNNNTGGNKCLSDNNVEDSIVAAGSVTTGDIATKGGTVNSGTFGNSGNTGNLNTGSGFINTGNMQKGMQFGKTNIAINGGGSAHVSNHSGQSHNSGIIEQSKNNSGIIINQQQGSGSNDYPNGISTTDGHGGKGGSGGGNNNVNAMIDNSTTIVEDKREFLAQPMITFGALGEYKEGADMGANFQTVEMLTMFKSVFSYEAAYEDYGRQYGEGKCKTIGHSYNGRHEDDPSKEIKVFTLNDKIDPSTVKVIGFATVIAVKKGITSFMVLQKAVLSASLMKADAFVVTKQGAETVTKSSGWGLGFNTSGGLIAEDGDRGKSAVGSGGTGYSNGTARLLTKPWMKIQVLKFK